MAEKRTKLEAEIKWYRALADAGYELTELDKEELAKAEAELREFTMTKTRRVKQAQWRGKNAERRLAKKVGGVVVGRSKAIKLESGKVVLINCQKPPDVVTDMFAFESKSWKEIPKSVEKLMTQATANCPEGLIPVGVIYDRAGRLAYYIMNELDFIELHI